ncbi:LysR family transcriptional regulator [Oceanimonas baumannii]|uniref:DNA-binding transcriptional LysR family regulator n=1 Tax=Oceanimonas baumannii TaxID=129578 RepID=A0A235CAY6_9GAMM|nr:LysR family transcriptional regulator [Oceanimonas baumannii]MCC4264774.1 LysR family transcriptional regulator [Oceanimonas baumannii]OYD21137.1 hypothetical protein B6S09_17125 [Oceanimonas baumannii]TDW54395.1 DNA-binding transcriptional LysR family regulator [Oceanimonas baumannii]
MAKVDFELKQIQVFTAVAKTLSFSAAAKQLNVSQSAISQHIAKLESSYGVPLIQRHCRPVTLTDAGKKLFRFGEAWLSQAMNMHNELQLSHSSHMRVLRLGVIDSLTPVMAPLAVEHFSDKVQSLSVQSGVITGLNSAFQAGELDMLITASIAPESNTQNTFLLARDPYVLIAPSDKARLTFSEMVQQLSYIGYDKRSQIGKSIQSIFQQHDIQVSSTVSVDSFDTLSKLVSSGLGWGLVSAFSLQSITALSPYLIVRNVLEGNYSRDVYLVTSSTLPKDFVDYARKRFQGLLTKTVKGAIQKHFPLISFLD